MEIEAYRSYIIRVPRFTIETLSILNYQSRMDLIQNMLKDEIFESSIKYSSPILFDEVFVRQKDTSVDDKLFLTLLAYNIRMSTRATPFGYLAGLGAGTIGENDKVIINSHNFHINSQPKFEALESRAQLLENDKKIRKYLKWCSNSSLYTINDEIRYYEIKNSNRKTSFYLTSLGSSKYIEEVIELADKGSTFDNLVDYLVSNDILEGSAESFINELIDSQILISEIKPTICGKSPEFFFHNKVNTLQNRVLNINNDKSNYINPNNEQDIKTIIKSNKISISKQTLTKIKETFLALNKIPVNHQSFHFKEFIRSFKKRYGTQQVDLCEALDLSYGVGYPINPNYEDDFIRNNLVISDIQKKSKVLNWSEFVASLNQELQSKNNIKNNTLYLQNSFFDQFENADKFSSSFSILVELYKFNEETKIYFDAALGNSATKLFSKYSNTQKEIGSLVQEICEVEHKQNTNAILAEIIHLPSSGVSEIVQTGVKRDFEITVLTPSQRSVENQIPLKDLCVYMQGDELVLKSKKLDKRIKPILSNAHNYADSKLGVYRFLCDYSYYKQRKSVNFIWGSLKEVYKRLPRVELNNVIISKAKWFLNKSDLKAINSTNSFDEKYRLFKCLKKQYEIVDEINFVERDRTLYIHTENDFMLKLFFSRIKNKINIELEEFLFSKGSVVNDTNGNNYANQFIIPFYTNKKD